jgi:respiratory burst oxidase
VTSRIRRKFPWLKSQSSSRTSMSDTEERNTISARDAHKIRAGLQRKKSSAQQALKGLRFISKSTARGASHADELCRNEAAWSGRWDGWRSWARRRGLGLMFGI